MPICYVLGGMGESTLARQPNNQDVVWIDLAVLMLGKTGELRLAANGVDPGPPDGVQVYATNLIGPYAGFPTAILRLQLVVRGYSTREHPWDWRKAIYPAGQALAARIRTEVTPSDPCGIVAHSAGGLVARAAWTDLGTTGDQGLVRRIVTCGTPHWGSYATVLFWSGSSPVLDLINYWNQDVGNNTAGWSPTVTGYQYRSSLYYQQLAMTWPSFYDQLPTLGQPGITDDPDRAALYTASNWPAAARPSQAWLDWSRDHTGPWLRSAASMPPSHVLTCLTGYGEDVPSALVDPLRLGSPAAIGRLVKGDNSVTEASGTLSTGTIWRYTINHENWLPQLANNGELADYVTEVKTPAPPPPPETVEETPVTNVQPLPFPEGLGSTTGLQQCLRGACYC